MEVLLPCPRTPRRERERRGGPNRRGEEERREERLTGVYIPLRWTQRTSTLPAEHVRLADLSEGRRTCTPVIFGQSQGRQEISKV